MSLILHRAPTTPGASRETFVAACWFAGNQSMQFTARAASAMSYNAVEAEAVIEHAASRGIELTAIDRGLALA